MKAYYVVCMCDGEEGVCGIYSSLEKAKEAILEDVRLFLGDEDPILDELQFTDDLYLEVPETDWTRPFTYEISLPITVDFPLM